MKKPIHRLEEYINYKGLSLNRFDSSIDKTGGYTGKQIKAEGSIGSDILQKILLTYPELSAQWLLTGEGNMIKDEFSKPKTIDEMIEEKIEAKLSEYSIEDMKMLHIAREFVENKLRDLEEKSN